MTSNRKRTLTTFGWSALVLSLIAVTYFNASNHTRPDELRRRLAELREEHKKLREEIDKGFVSVRTAGQLSYTRGKEKRDLVAMLRQSSSRNDFVLREGPRIAWSTLSGAKDRSLRIGLYVPAGRHRLSYAYLNSRTNPGKELEDFRTGDVRNLKDVVCLEQGPIGEVYEIQFAAYDLDGSPQVTILGGDDRTLHERALPIGNPVHIHADLPYESVAYPSEVSISRFRQHVTTQEQEQEPFLPIVELGMLRIHQTRGIERAEIRLWIESDAQACIPAAEVSAHYQEFAHLAAGRTGPSIRMSGLEMQESLERLFKPYDGSELIYFREEFFLPRED